MATATRPAANTGKSTEHIISDRGMFHENFDKQSFEFAHNLAQHPLFHLDRLIELARVTQSERPDDLFYDAGTQDLNQRWSDSPKPKFSAAEAVERIESCGAWIVLKRADKDPEYRKLLDECMAEIQDLSGLNLNRVMKMQEVILFITSPKRITTYHIDRECSLLMQIRGTKDINIFSRNDRDILSEEEIEKFWTVDHNAPRYKPEFQSHAQVYQLRPGVGVHIPVNFPHWVQNGDDISISLNVNFQYRDPIRANLYRMNYLLRKAGLTPTPPGKSRLKDSVKSAVILPAVWSKNILRGRKPWA
jgi:hypothetical protein